jgi:hypothetical protein
LTLFSLGGAFANISYTDILGKSILNTTRKQFFSIKQVVAGILLLVSSLIARKVLVSSVYPQNYSMMYFIAFISLFVASIGFWRIKEKIPSNLKVRGVSDFIRIIKTELKENRRLKYFLGFINTMGVSMTLLPFVILYAKESHGATNSDVGSFLILKIVGSVLMGFLLYKLSKRFKYKYLLYINLLIVLLLPLLLIVFNNNPPFLLIFLIGGIIYSMYSITMNGILLEISSSSNRAIYTGIAGAGNMLPAIFPLIAGGIITRYSLHIFLLIYDIIILLSLYFIYKLNCES